jgi:peptidyl-prolyl cis-trans isomerase SurA
MKRLAAMFASAALLGASGLAWAQTAAPPSGPAAATAPAAGRPRGQLVEGVVALVNDQAISQSDVRNRMQLLLLSFPGKPDEQVLREVQQHATETLIEEKLKVAEFHKMLKKAKIEPQEIDERIAAIAKGNNLPPEQFLAQLRAQGISISSLRDQIEADLSWNTLVGARYSRQVRISDPRIDEVMERLKESNDKPQYRLAEIFLYAPDSASRSNAMQRASTFKTQIEQGARFDQVAQQFSAAPSATQGGDLGFMSLGDMRPEIQKAVLAGKPPSVLEPIESEGGVYLIALLGKREPADANAATLDLKQVVAKGDAAGTKLEIVRQQAKSCSDAITEGAKQEGVTVVDMNGVVLSQVSDAYKAALTPLEVGQSTEVMDIPDGKMTLFVCKREAAGGQKSRAQVKNELFNAEIDMLADRYLRDMKREATIIRR